ncbi:ATP-dependent Clp protease ATP-binding subunit [Treponema sp.]|uniref:ATP-dependent Clp protease ATP-binding subunit n=1 Tax=Treponema sp. TaxID=166 RepID=UPI003FA33661
MHQLSLDLYQLLSEFSQHEAQRVNAAEVEPEHVLLALIMKRVGRGYQLLQALHINFLNLQLVLEQKTPIRKGEPVHGEIPLSNKLKLLIDTAAAQAYTMQHEAAGTEHLILAFAHIQESILARFFAERGIFVADVQRELDKMNGAKHIRQPEGQDGQQNKKRDKKKHSVLAECSRDLTQITREGRLDPVIGRTRELKRVMQILSRRNKNNPVLIGEPGVGKTSVVEGLAAAIVKEQVPRSLFGKRIIALDLASVIAGTKYRGQFEERIKRIIAEVSEAKDIILFIDELHTLIGTGGSQGSLDAANMLKPALARGEIQCIGATTLDEYRKYFEKDSALERRFQSVFIKEPTPEETCAILGGLKSKYERHHHVHYSDETIKKIVELSSRYLSDRFFPDKAIDVMDEAGALKKMDNTELPQSLNDLEQRIAELSQQKNDLAATQNYEQAATVRDEIKLLKSQLEKIKLRWLNEENEAVLEVETADVAETIALMTDIPIKSLGSDEAKRLAATETELHKTIVGQDEAIGIIANALRRSRAGIASADRPIGSFLFLGPTGVGKTLLAKALADFLFGSADALVRIDMSDYMEKHAAARLVGAPPGYIGFEEGGMLTEKIRRHPYSVILFDEIEKAHPDVFNLLLQVLEEGELQDSLGHTVNFRNTVIIFTGNLGTKNLLSEPLGFTAPDNRAIDYQSMKKSAELEAKKVFSPEFLNRLDSLIVFTPLSEQEIEAVFELELAKLTARLSAKQLTVRFSGAARSYCIRHGYDPLFGARPMRRLLQTEIEDALAVKIITGEFTAGDTAAISTDGDEALTISIEKKVPLVTQAAITLLPEIAPEPLKG